MTNAKSDVKSRAMAAWIKRRGVQRTRGLTPVRASVGEHQYVVLKQGKTNVAVYRIRTDGILKILRRWPKEFQQSAGNEP